jgi:hypothetical protein
MTAFANLRCCLERPVVAGKRLIGLSIPDTQHENPRGVRKGRLLTRLRHSSYYEAAAHNRRSGHPKLFGSEVQVGYDT